MRRQFEVSSLLLLSSLALGAGCNPSSGDSSTPDLGVTPDAGMTGTDAGPPGSDAGSCGTNVVPTSGFGTTIGRNFSDFTLNDCSSPPVPYEFYNQDFCTSTLSVVIISAGWCEPCNLETDQIEAMLIGPYGPRGVRVIQVLTQDDNPARDGLPTTAGFCARWISEHHLSMTDHHTLLDPDGATQIYNPAGAIPATVIIDGDGVIQDRFNGTAEDPTSGTAALNDITDCLDKLLMSPRQLCH